jgi:hypothetical protein
MSYANGPRIVTDGLVLCLDAGNRKSYIGTGSTWTDIAGNNNCTLYSNPSFNNNNQGYLSFNTSSNAGHYGRGGISNWFTNEFTIEATFYHTSSMLWEALWSNNAGSSWSNNDKEAPLLTFNGASTNVWHQIGINQAGTSVNGVWLDLTANHLNKWVSVWLTRSGTSINIYAIYDNTWLNNSGTYTYTINTTRNNYIVGRHWYNSGSTSTQLFKGHISNIKVYNKVLTFDQIQQNQKALKGRFGL